MDRPEQTLSAVLDAGELLLTSGVLRSSRRSGHHAPSGTRLRFLRADVLTITASSMAVTVPDGRRSGDHADTPHPAARNRYALH